MSYTCTAEIGEQRLETGTLCAICGEFVPIPDVRQTVFPICEECRRRAKKLLYPEETIDGNQCKISARDMKRFL